MLLICGKMEGKMKALVNRHQYGPTFHQHTVASCPCIILLKQQVLVLFSLLLSLSCSFLILLCLPPMSRSLQMAGTWAGPNPINRSFLYS